MPSELFFSEDNLLYLCDESKTNLCEFQFNNIFYSENESNDDIYKNCISPLLEETISGKNTVITLCGSPYTNNDQYISSQLNKSHINKIANVLLNSLNKNNTITFSWLKIDCNEEEENVIDILKSATDPTGKKDYKLNFRELVKGRGIAIPGLTQIELINDGDIDAIIEQVQKAHHLAVPDSNSHTIFQFNYNTKLKPNNSNSKSLPLLENASSGKLSLVLLSALSYESPTSDSDEAFEYSFPWVKQLLSNFELMESKRENANFESSKILHFLRDSINKVQPSSFILQIKPNKANLVESLMWLKLITYIQNLSFIDQDNLQVAIEDEETLPKPISPKVVNKNTMPFSTPRPQISKPKEIEKVEEKHVEVVDKNLSVKKKGLDLSKSQSYKEFKNQKDVKEEEKRIVIIIIITFYYLFIIYYLLFIYHY